MALPGNVMNSEVINGTPLYLNEAKMALDFLVEKLGFVVNGRPVSKNPDGVPVCDGQGNLYKIFSAAQKSVSDQNDFQPIINTTDCLRDFYNMAPKGLTTLSKPHYLPEGLAFEILDPWGNKYTFLEKRNYAD